MAHCVFQTTWPRWWKGPMVPAWIPRSCSSMSFHDTTTSTTTGVYRPYLSCSSVAVYIRSPHQNKPNRLKTKLAHNQSVKTMKKRTLRDGSKAFHLHLSLTTMITSLISPRKTNEHRKKNAGARSVDYEPLHLCKPMRNYHSMTYIYVLMDESCNAHVNLVRVLSIRRKLC